MSRRNLEALEEDYAEWLEENCQCNPSHDDCDCIAFEEWLYRLEASAVEGMDEQDLEEHYA